MIRKPILSFDEMESPIGNIIILVTENGVAKIHFGEVDESLPLLKAWSKKVFLTNELEQNPIKLQPVKEQLQHYFNGTLKQFDLDIDMKGTPFQQKVWNELLNVSYGETKSYKDIAIGINAPKAVRAVGNAVNRNPLPIIVPCHRVIGSNGELVGYNGGLKKKQTLLQIENALEKIG